MHFVCASKSRHAPLILSSTFSILRWQRLQSRSTLMMMVRICTAQSSTVRILAEFLTTFVFLRVSISCVFIRKREKKINLFDVYRAQRRIDQMLIATDLRLPACYYTHKRRKFIENNKQRTSVLKRRTHSRKLISERTAPPSTRLAPAQHNTTQSNQHCVRKSS